MYEFFHQRIQPAVFGTNEMSKEFDLYVGYYEFICYGICWAYSLFPGKRVFGMCYEDQGDGLLENRNKT